MNQVLKSCKKVKNELVDVTIDTDRVKSFAKLVAKQDMSKQRHIDLFSEEQSIAEKLMILFVFNSMNFCFWAELDKAKWKIVRKGKEYDGSIALFVLIEQTPELRSLKRIRSLTLEEFRSILMGNIQIPLVEERYKNLQVLASVIEDKYKGNVEKILSIAGYKADQILKLLVSEFPCFQDDSPLDGSKVFYWKRAQLQVKMMYDATRDISKEITNIEYLTAFADYKIPQLLRHLGIITYSLSLSEMIDSYTVIPKDSRMENEIRIATILAVECIKEELVRMGISITACEVDNILWNRATTNKDEMKPYHRTYTCAY